MQTQRDHVHAQSFMMGRLSSALVMGDPSSAEIPGRRALTGLLLGLLVVTLVAAGFAIYGWIVPGGSKAYKQAGAILVEKETGTRYVYLNGVLHPTPNLTSAMLVQGPSAKVKLISRKSLKDIPRGVSIGIAGAPQIIPEPAALATGPWLACLPGSIVDNPSDGLGVNLNPRVATAALPVDRFAVVKSLKGPTFLLAWGHKFRVEDDAVLVALGAANVRPTRAPATWLSWLPDGPALAPADIDGAGTDGPKVGGKTYPVGTLFRQRPASGEEQLFVLRKDGLAPLSRTEFLLADAKNGGDPVELDTGAVVDSKRSADRSLTDRLPELANLRWQDAPGQVLCVSQRPDSAETFSTAVVFAPWQQSGVDARGQVRVMTPPASGMVVLPVPVQSKITPDVSFISDEGQAFILNGDTRAALKFNNAAAVPFPRSLLAALPQGPVLSRGAVTGLAGG